ncbi:hypothetical protein [Salipiger thiooxidans]|uniref:hypothetical protein n=1 Tax=Salipiger thiooxidans TaxID=282683 RepID=UPI001CD5962E|nr:hypothetical protein [Salipiger thiooxidans]MCA0849198.1 hypothetical protein [Salipiger thiooxidans]
MTRRPTKSSQKKRSDPRELARFVEELSWLLKSFEDIDYNALSNFSHQAELFISNSEKFRPSSSVDQNSMVLVGILPNFLMDTKLFPVNEGIVEFAEAALGLPLRRWQKKSRYEIIGQIVCHANEASPEKIARLSEIIEEMHDNQTSIRNVIETNREQGRSWSEVIGRLYDGL